MILLLACLVAMVIGFYGGMMFERTPLDDGPWGVATNYGRPIGVESDDCGTCVTLLVEGEFEHRQHKLEYCEWLAATLNAGEKHG